jgi:Holliday junction resolvase
MEREKGARIEREIVNAHRKMGIRAERYPLSGSSRFRGSGHDVDIYAFGVDEAPAVGEIKGRASGKGFTMLERWLGEYDVLFLRRDRADPLVVLPWRVWKRLIGGKDGAETSTDGPRPGKPESGAGAEA